MKARGALHLHSHYSYDAKLSLSQLRELFLAHGLHFALMTEHTDEMNPDQAEAFMQACKGESTGDFLFIPGFEVPYKQTHVLMVGADRFVCGGPVDAEGLRQWRSTCGLAILAHPHRNSYVVDDALLQVIDGQEIWNSQYDGKYVPRTGARQLYKRLQKKKEPLLAFGGWDLHREAHAGGPVVEVEVSGLTLDAVLAELTSGRFSVVSNATTVSSHGQLLRGSERAVRIRSFLFVSTITLFKWINKVLHSAGLRAPRRLVRYVRARL